MPRHKDTESQRVAGEFTPGSPAFWPQEDFPQGILDGDLVRYVAANELWERESVEDFLAELKSYFDTIYTGGSSYTHPNHTGEVTSVGDGATTIANKQTLTATAPLAVTNSPKVIASAAPVLSISAATTDAPGSMSAADKTRLDGMEDLAVALTTVKADSDIADALSKAHAAGSDDQDLSGLVTKESTSPDPTGYLPEYDATGNLVKSSKLSSSVHPALTIDGTSPLSLSGQAISLQNDAAAAITEVDTGALANSDTVIPTSKAVKTAIGAGGGGVSIYWQIAPGESVTVAERTQYPVFHLLDHQGTMTLAAGAELIVHS
jgi:hypothetical protein